MTSGIIYEKLKRGDTLLFARVIPNIGYYEILETHLVNLYPTYCTVTDVRTRQTYIVDRKRADKVLYTENERKKALKFLKEERIRYKDVVVATE